MGKLNLFDITLNNPLGVYYPGQEMLGEVTVELNEEMKMRGIRLHFYGGARVRWSEGSSNNRRTYSSYETYFSYELVLFGKASGQGGDNPTLPPGRHTYPFQYQLPQTIPSSYEGGYGRVRYWLLATIDKPWKFDHTTKRAFTVLGNLDLNTEPGTMEGERGEGSKTLCCLCCKSGPISCTFQIDRCGYVPGESIPIRGEIINYSNRMMNRSFAALMMDFCFETSHGGLRPTHDCRSPKTVVANDLGAKTIVIVYRARSKSRVSHLTAAEISKAEIPPGESDTWTGELLPIPPLPPSGLRGCSIIDITYYVKLCADPAGPGFDLEVPLKVIIGTIPLQVTLQQYGLGAPAPAPSSAELYQQPSMPPPSYAESAFGGVDIRDADDSEYVKGNTQYAPMYAYYNWGNSTTPSAPHPS